MQVGSKIDPSNLIYYFDPQTASTRLPVLVDQNPYTVNDTANVITIGTQTATSFVENPITIKSLKKHSPNVDPAIEYVEWLTKSTMLSAPQINIAIPSEFSIYMWVKIHSAPYHISYTNYLGEWKDYQKIHERKGQLLNIPFNEVPMLVYGLVLFRLMRLTTQTGTRSIKTFYLVLVWCQ